VGVGLLTSTFIDMPCKYSQLHILYSGNYKIAFFVTYNAIKVFFYELSNDSVIHRFNSIFKTSKYQSNGTRLMVFDDQNHLEKSYISLKKKSCNIWKYLGF